MNASQIILQLLNGLVVGSSLALVAAGLALLFGVLDVINFAQGDLFMLGGYVAWFTFGFSHNYVLAVVLATVVVGVVGGLLVLAFVWPLLQKAQVLVLLATLGLSLIIEQTVTNVVGGDAKLVQPPLDVPVPIGPVDYPLYDLLILVTGMAVLTAGFFALKYTKYGIWLRAVAQNRPMAAVLGVPVPKVYIVAFMISSGLAALAGALLLPITSVYPAVGADVILNAFIIVVAGGLGNFRGAAVLAIVVGELQSLGSLAIPPAEVNLLLFAFVIVMLALRSRRQTVLARL